MTISIAAICVWNEEQFIRQCIENIMAKVRDIAVIEILDGAWKPYSENYYPLSQDETKDIVMELQEKYKHLCKIVWREPGELGFESESQKRNRQLDIIREEYQDYIVFVLDADETIHSATGQQYFHINYYMALKPAIGCIKAFALGSRVHGWTPRLFWSGYNIHYHTKRVMEVHGFQCKIKIPYDPKSQENWSVPSGAFEITDFILVNSYVKRDILRREQKLESRKYEAILQASECDYK